MTDIDFITAHISGITLTAFSVDEVLQDSMMFRLIQISENARKLSDSYKNNHGYIPWNSIYGLRNRIVHDYGNVDFNIVYDTVKNDIPALKNCFEIKFCQLHTTSDANSFYCPCRFNIAFFPVWCYYIQNTD